MAPMSSAYDHLEAGRSPSPELKTKPKLFAWTKFALGVGLLFVLMCLLLPKEKRGLPGWGVGKMPCEEEGRPGVLDTSPMRLQKIPDPPAPLTPTPPTMLSHADEDIPHAESFESDPDPSKTTHCKTPHSSADDLVQYSLIIDAGSTSSRIHIFKFNNCGPSPAYEYVVFKMTRPGLPFFVRDPGAAAASLDVLLDEAMRVVPAHLHKCTPVVVKATAGLRVLPGSRADDILAAVSAHLRSAYPFVLPADGVAVVDSADQGVFTWVTANYLLKTVRADTPPDTTFAVLDLWGAGTRIVFEPARGTPLHEGEHKYELEFEGKTRVLYQHSYVGYGLMRARASVHRLVDSTSPLHDQPAPPALVSNPCLARGTQRTVDVSENWRAPREVVMDGGDVGGFDACARLVERVLAKDAVCAVSPCAFGGVYQPALSEAFPAHAGRVLLLSYFYDRVAPLVPKPEKDELITATVDTFAELARTVCAGRDEWLLRWGTQKTLIAELEGRPEWCLDLTFIHGLLRTGYEFDGSREVMFGKEIAGTELGWCLGAGIKLVGGVEVQCRV